MANRYWVGGTGTWSSGNTSNWSTTSGGAGGASVPTSADAVIIDANSGSGVITFTNNTVTVIGVTFNNGSITLSLNAAFATSGIFTLSAGTLVTNNFNFTADRLSSSNSNIRTINLGSSNVTLTGDTPLTFATSTNLTFNAGTSTITCSSNNVTFSGGGQTFWNVSFTAANLTNTMSIAGTNTFNNLSFAGRTSTGVNAIAFNNNQVINGILTASPSSFTGTARTFFQSSALGLTRTLTCATVDTLTDVDFRDITIAGSASPVSGTRLGDCGGNSGITFPAPKTVWWNLSGNQNWTAIGWATSMGGTPANANFPLAQDTASFSNPGAGAGAIITINANFNIGSINLSSRTNSLTLTVSTNTPVLYGSFTNGTNTTIGGTGTITFSGRGANTLLTAGRTFNPALTVAAPGGSLTLSDALTCASSSAGALRLTAGTLNTNNYNVSITNATGTFISSGTETRALNMGSSTITVAGSGTAFTVGTGAGITLTGTGIISLTSASAKTFAGGSIQTYPTLNQGGTGTLTVTGSNKFANITDTAIGRVQFTGGTTNIFDAFNLGGVAGNLLQVGSTNTTQATLQKSSVWLMGANSVDNGNNTGLSFIAGDGVDYLSVSYINGTVSAPSTITNVYFGADNTLQIYYGSNLVNSIYFGSTKVWG